MRIEDLAFLLSAPDRPGRSLLRVSWEATFKAQATEVAGGISLPLPVAETGFVRLWSFLTFIANAHVATDIYTLQLNFGTALNMSLFNVFSSAINCALSEVPLIGARVIRPGVVAGTIVHIIGLDGFLVSGPDSQLFMVGGVTPASGQFISVQGRYVDLPV